MTEPTDDEGVEFPVLSEEELNDLNRLVLFDPQGETTPLQDFAETNYKAMTRKERRQVLLAEYSCRTRGCLLLHVWNTPQGRCYYQPRYALSPEVNKAESVEAARQKRTSDGNHKWMARWGSLDELLEFCGEEPDLGIDLNCDHVRERITGRRLGAAVDGVTPGSPGDPILLPDDDTPKGFAGALDCPDV
jgi:hypothetical protein